MIKTREWLRDIYTPMTALEREEKAADSDPSSEEQALVWVARQTPLSIDSHERFMLFLKEVIARSPGSGLWDGFYKVPWWSILDLTSWNYLQRALGGTLSEEDKEGIGLLTRCLEVPAVRAKLDTDAASRLSASYRRGHTLEGTERQHPNAASLLSKDTIIFLSRAIFNSPYSPLRSSAFSALCSLTLDGKC